MDAQQEQINPVDAVDIEPSYLFEMWAASEGIEMKRLYSISNVLSGTDALEPIEPLYLKKPEMIVEYLEEYAHTRPKLYNKIEKSVKSPEQTLSSKKLATLIPITAPVKGSKKDTSSQTINSERSGQATPKATPVPPINIPSFNSIANPGPNSGRKQDTLLPRVEEANESQNISDGENSLHEKQNSNSQHIFTRKSQNKNKNDKIKKRLAPSSSKSIKHINDQEQIIIDQETPKEILLQEPTSTKEAYHKHLTFKPKIKQLNITCQKHNRMSLPGKFSWSFQAAISSKPVHIKSQFNKEKEGIRHRNISICSDEICIPMLAKPTMSIDDYTSSRLDTNNYDYNIDTVEPKHKSDEKMAKLLPFTTSSNTNTDNEHSVTIRAQSPKEESNDAMPPLKLNSLNYSKVQTSYNYFKKSVYTRPAVHKIVTEKPKTGKGRHLINNNQILSSRKRFTTMSGIESKFHIEQQSDPKKFPNDPYSLTWGFKILKNYFNIQCEDAGRKISGVPLLKIRKIHNSVKHI